MNDKFITLNHGAGGETMRSFIKKLFVENFSNAALNTLADAALLDFPGKQLAFTTDSYVVKPLEFPGGNIGKLAVCGTVNDLAVMGAKPLFLSAGFIIEEGFDFAALERIVRSMAETADAACVRIVTGDTKVVARGEADGLFINTSGAGVYPLAYDLHEKRIAKGDAMIVSGTVGDHGIAILGARGNLSFRTQIQSDCAALNGLIESALRASSGVKWMRDPTRGGLAAVLTELAEEYHLDLLVREKELPVRDDVRAVCELLGFDPMHLANEGKVVMVAESSESDNILSVLRRHELGKNAALIGHVADIGTGIVRIETEVGGVRRLQRPAGELLPRIC